MQAGEVGTGEGVHHPWGVDGAGGGRLQVGGVGGSVGGAGGGWRVPGEGALQPLSVEGGSDEGHGDLGRQRRRWGGRRRDVSRVGWGLGGGRVRGRLEGSLAGPQPRDVDLWHGFR